jgi:hypothetical protein
LQRGSFGLALGGQACSDVVVGIAVLAPAGMLPDLATGTRPVAFPWTKEFPTRAKNGPHPAR